MQILCKQPIGNGNRDGNPNKEPKKKCQITKTILTEMKMTSMDTAEEFLSLRVSQQKLPKLNNEEERQLKSRICKNCGVTTKGLT